MLGLKLIHVTERALSSPLHFLTVSAIPPCLCDTFPKFGDLLSHREYIQISEIASKWRAEALHRMTKICQTRIVNTVTRVLGFLLFN